MCGVLESLIARRRVRHHIRSLHLKVLCELFNIELKLNAKAMCDQMKAMRDEAGGLLFCWSK
jgi:hypothetical protein